MLELFEAFDISVSELLASLIFGIIGMWMWAEGRRMQKMHIKILAGILMFYPYVTPKSKNDWLDWAVGIVLCAVARHYWDKESFS